MSVEPAHLGALLAERPDNMGLRSISLYMTDAEVSEMTRRDALGDRVSLVVQEVSGVWEPDITEGAMPDYGANFGGIWGDQLDGGRMVLAVVDASLLAIPRIHALVGGVRNLKIVEQPYTYNEVEQYRAALHRELTTLGIAHDIATSHSDTGRLLEIWIEDPAQLPSGFAAAVPTDVFSVVRRMPSRPASRPWEPHSLFMPGEMFEVRGGDGTPGGGGMWAFNGHTSSYSYLITAGHTLDGDPPYDYSNYVGLVGEAVNLWQGYPSSSSRDLTLGDTYVVSVYLPANNLDAARLESTYANSNFYHGDTDVSVPDPHYGWWMKNRAIEPSWEEGYDRTCASLGSSGIAWGPVWDYQCGYIIDETFNGVMLLIGVTARSGDSGAGFKWDYRIDGMLTALSGFNAVAMTAYDVKTTLGSGFDYNCALVRQTTSPSYWGTCPAVDA